MSATPPEADIEYSRGSEPDPGASEASQKPRARALGRRTTIPARALRTGILGGGLLGALLLLVAEFTALFSVHAAGLTLRTVGTGSHHGYALVPVALLAGLLAFVVARIGSRTALAAIGALGLITLGIALLGDLPDAQATGLVFRGGHYVSAGSQASVGLYMETLGGVAAPDHRGLGLSAGRRPAAVRRITQRDWL